MLDPIEKLRRLVTLGMWCGCEECHQTLENGIAAIHAKGYAEAADALERMEKVNLEQSLQVAAKLNEFVEAQETIAALRAEIEELKNEQSHYSVNIAEYRAENAALRAGPHPKDER